MVSNDNIITSIFNSYKQHKSKRNLNNAINSVLGNMSLSEFSKFNKTTADDRAIFDSLRPILDNTNTNQKYPKLNNDTQQKVNEFLNTKRKKRCQSIPSCTFTEKEMEYFPMEDQLINGTSTANHFSKLLEESTKLQASKVYCRHIDKFAYSEIELLPEELSQNIETLKLVYTFDKHLNLSRLPTPHNFLMLMKNMKFLENYKYNKEEDNKENEASNGRVHFKERVRSKYFYKTDSTETIRSKLKRNKTNVNDGQNKKILKVTENAHFAQEIKLAHYCDLIDSGSFIKLIDTNMRVRVKLHSKYKFHNKMKYK